MTTSVANAETITACANKTTGVLRLSTDGKCVKKTEARVKWNQKGLTGPAGPTGAAGAPGSTGTAGRDGVDGKSGTEGKSGNTILSGTSDPTAAIGSTGDFYLNTATNKLFGPKTTTWGTGTSLVGPSGVGTTGPAGPAGPSGPSGPSGPAGPAGANGAPGATGPQGETGVPGVAGLPGKDGYSSMWFTPRDLYRGDVAGLPADSSTVASIIFNGGYPEEVLDIAFDMNKYFWRAVPNGWGSANSTTWRIYWTTDEAADTQTVGFAIYLNTGVQGDTITSYLAPACSSSCSQKLQKAPLGVGKLNVTEVTIPNVPYTTVGRLIEGGVLHIAFSRASAFYTGVDPWYSYPGDLNYGGFLGKVYVFGMSVVANFGAPS